MRRLSSDSSLPATRTSPTDRPKFLTGRCYGRGIEARFASSVSNWHSHAQLPEVSITAPQPMSWTSSRLPCTSQKPVDIVEGEILIAARVAARGIETIGTVPDTVDSSSARRISTARPFSIGARRPR